MRQRALRVELRQLVPQIVITLVLVEGDLVLAERGFYTVAREHGGAFDHSGGADAVDTHIGRKGDGQFAHQVAERRL